ncbi:MAG: hypothetical protein HY920_05695 [Elusimicrobia bacterium]|nr:hypothetical protein [Elusimicrobiota bacterium]
MSKELTSLFSQTASHIIEGVIKSGGIVGGVKIIGGNGILLKNNKLSNRVQKEIIAKTGVKGFISTDELPQYGINAADQKKIMVSCGASDQDVVVLVADQREKVLPALDIIAARLTGKTRKAAPKPKKKAAKPTKKAEAKKAAKSKKEKKVFVKKKARKKK